MIAIEHQLRQPRRCRSPQLGLAIEFTDRDVVIARAEPAGGTGARRANAQAHTFQAADPACTLPVAVPAEVVRGWSTRRRQGPRRDVPLREHAPRGLQRVVRNRRRTSSRRRSPTSPYPVVLAGDLNSQPTDSDGRVRADAVDRARRRLGGRRGTGRGFTSGQTDPLTNVPSQIDHRIDYVLYDPDGSPELRALDAEVLGEELDDRATSTVTGTPRLLVALGPRGRRRHARRRAAGHDEPSRRAAGDRAARRAGPGRAGRGPAGRRGGRRPPDLEPGVGGAGRGGARRRAHGRGLRLRADRLPPRAGRAAPATAGRGTARCPGSTSPTAGSCGRCTRWASRPAGSARTRRRAVPDLPRGLQPDRGALCADGWRGRLSDGGQTPRCRRPSADAQTPTRRGTVPCRGSAPRRGPSCPL